MSNIKKIFVIGFNKTGTSSIQKILKMYNINSIHSTTPVLEIIDQYDAFCDGIHTNFIDYFNKYPNSLFILNTRPLGKWLISRYKHAKGRNYIKSWCWPITTERTNKWINDRQQHYKNVFNFFKKRPHQLFVVNIESENWQFELVRFLKLKKTIKYETANPNNIHRNIIREESIDETLLNEIIINVNNSLSIKNYQFNDLLCKGLDLNKFSEIKMYL